MNEISANKIAVLQLPFSMRFLEIFFQFASIFSKLRRNPYCFNLDRLFKNVFIESRNVPKLGLELELPATAASGSTRISAPTVRR